MKTGLDPHCLAGANLMGITYEEFRKRFEAGDPGAVEWRWHAKEAAFAAKGGMGPGVLRTQGERNRSATRERRRKQYGWGLPEAELTDEQRAARRAKNDERRGER